MGFSTNQPEEEASGERRSPWTFGKVDSVQSGTLTGVRVEARATHWPKKSRQRGATGPCPTTRQQTSQPKGNPDPSVMFSATPSLSPGPPPLPPKTADLDFWPQGSEGSVFNCPRCSNACNWKKGAHRTGNIPRFATQVEWSRRWRREWLASLPRCLRNALRQLHTRWRTPRGTPASDPQRKPARKVWTSGISDHCDGATNNMTNTPHLARNGCCTGCHRPPEHLMTIWERPLPKHTKNTQNTILSKPLHVSHTHTHTPTHWHVHSSTWGARRGTVGLRDTEPVHPDICASTGSKDWCCVEKKKRLSLSPTE